MALSPPASALTDGIVTLRPIDERDLEAVERGSQDPEIRRRFGLANRSTRDYVAACKSALGKGTGIAFAISHARRDDCLGQVLLEVRDGGRADVGYWLLPEARGRGRAPRALALAARWALSQPGIARLQLWTSPENVASQRVAERSGFQREGVLRSYAEVEGRGRVDAVFFSLLPSDLEPSS